VSGDKLTPLQWRILKRLARLEPAWTLTGGAALAGIHLRHRETRDLDLFWRRRRELGPIPRAVQSELEAEGLAVRVLQTAPTFCRLSASVSGETCIVDLVAEPQAALEPPLSMTLSGMKVSVDSSHEILVAKICTLLSRSEVRDLFDVQALLDAGGDLVRALADAPKKDAGFSPLTLSWVLETTDFGSIAKSMGWKTEAIEALTRFRDSLVQKLLAAGAPE